MKLATFAMSASLLALASACGEAPMTDEEGLVYFHESVSPTSTIEGLRDGALGFVQQMVLTGTAEQPAAEAGITESDVEEAINAAFLPYAETVDAAYFAATLEALEPGDGAMLGNAVAEAGMADATACLRDGWAAGEAVTWEICAERTDTELDPEFLAAYQRYEGSGDAAYGDPTVSTVFAGSICKVLDEMSERMTTDTSYFNFDGTTLSLGNSESEECPHWLGALAMIEPDAEAEAEAAQ